MSEQIKIMNKSFIDFDSSNVTITVTDDVATNSGQDFVNYLRDRKNTTGWATTNSDDTANCVMLVDLAVSQMTDEIILIGHNFKSYLLEAWNGTAWSTIINVTNNVETTNEHSFTAAMYYTIRLTIVSTQTANADKRMSQLIVTSLLGQFEGFPEITDVKHKTNKKINTMLSGKALVTEGLGAIEFDLSVKNWKNDNDLTLVERIYDNKIGFLVWICGGDEIQFSSIRKGYRKQDLYLMRTVDDYANSFYKSIYSSGNVISISLREAVK